MKKIRIGKAAATHFAVLITISSCATSPLQEMDGKTKSGLTGGIVGCVGGALLAHLAGKSAGAGCAVGAVAGALVGYEKARQEEIAAAEASKAEILAILNQTSLAQEPARQTTPSHVSSEVPTAEEVAATLARQIEASHVSSETNKSIAPAQNIQTQAEPAAVVQPKPSPVRATVTVDSGNIAVRDKSTGETKQVNALKTVTVLIPLSQRGTPEYEEAMGKLKAFATMQADERGASEIILHMRPKEALIQKVVSNSQSVKTLKGNTITVTRATDESVPKGFERVTIIGKALSTSF